MTLNALVVHTLREARITKLKYHTTAQASVKSSLTDAFEKNVGLKQEDGLATLLFNLALQQVTRNLRGDTNRRISG